MGRFQIKNKEIKKTQKQETKKTKKKKETKKKKSKLVDLMIFLAKIKILFFSYFIIK